jgi:hypothetical protein
VGSGKPKWEEPDEVSWKDDWMADGRRRRATLRNSRDVRDAEFGQSPGQRERAKGKAYRIPTDSEQLELIRAALHRGGMRYLQVQQQVRSLSRGHANELMAMNPFSGATWAKHLEAACGDLLGREASFFVTVLDHEFDTRLSSSFDPSSFLAQHHRRLFDAVQFRMAGVAYLLQLDIAIHRLPASSGQWLCPHFHGMAFGSGSNVDAALALFGEGFGGAPGGHKVDVQDLGGVLSYIAKDTRCRYRTVPKDSFTGRRARHCRERMYGPQLRLLLRLYDDWAKPELCVGSGRGSDILNRAIALAKRRGYVPFDGPRTVAAYADFFDLDDDSA